MSEYYVSSEHTVTGLFEQQVLETPEAVAIQHNGQQLTYHQLNTKAEQMALFLQKNGVRSHDFVALALDSGINFIVCILGILKAGGVYLPLDTLAPTQRLKEIINDASPKIIISSKKNLDDHGLTYDSVFEVNELMEEASHLISEHSFPIIEPTSPVYMMYTSGSTGRPKGVIVAHQAVVNLVSTDNFAKVGQREHVAQFSNLAFDGSTFEIWSALLNGATLVIIPPEIKTDHNKLLHFLKSNPVKYLFLPTGFFHQLINSAINTLDSVEVIIFGGEQVNVLLLKKLMAHRKKENHPVRLVNGYGPTEATTFTCRHVMDENGLDDEDELGSIGTPIDNVTLYVLDEDKKPAEEGELYISGINLAIQYHHCPVQNEEKFLPNPFFNEVFYERMYKTGDKVRMLPSGKLLFLERIDDQVKIGGFRIHLSEIENKLCQHPDISLAAVQVETGGGLHQILTAYIVLLSPDNMIHADEIRHYLGKTLPGYMLPAKYVLVQELPLTSVGKVDRTALDKLPHTDLSFHVDTHALSLIEEKIKAIWQHLLNRASIDVNKNLFELGANSLLITEACTRINEALQSGLEIADMLSYPTIRKLSRYLDGDIEIPQIKETKAIKSHDIAIIGMSCRFPKANTLEEYWQNLCESEDCLTHFSEQELDGTHKNQSIDTSYVPVRGTLADIDQFDAHFFGFNPVDASITDPQQRLFLECAWEALEHAAVAPEKAPEKIISVYAGMADSTYLHENLLKSNWFVREHDRFQSRISSSMGMLSTQVSYRLNLKGRSVNVNTACSTGLVVVDEACQALMADCCDIALAGAVSIVTPQNTGYLFQKGSIESPDGQCRPFSENANGTVFSNGVGVVILKRLADAIADKDTIYAVIKGRGVNNDGSDKLGFTAPSTSGQMACIRSALAEARLLPKDIGYIEAHGTATTLGDAVEIEALSRVFREKTDKTQFCALGSVKGNIGHADVAAGMAGLIKTALCLYHQKIPATLHFDKPNPSVALSKSPFFINTQLSDWKNVGTGRFAGVSAFGVGGTNAHLILGEYRHENKDRNVETKKEELFLLSAKTETALLKNREKLIQYLSMLPEESESEALANVAHTLRTGREDFQWRCFAAGNSREEIIKNLSLNINTNVDTNIHGGIVFMFPGQGTQYYQIATQLMEEIPFFSSLVQRGIDLAKPYLDIDLLEVINNPSDKRLYQTQYAQSALFIIEYALARLLIHYGLIPDAMIGHSIGEYTAACIAGIFSLEDAVALVCQRGILMANLPAGEMLAIECKKEELSPYLNQTELALHNSIHHSVVAGKPSEINQLEKSFLKMGKSFRKLKVSHAFHSREMEDIEQPFKDLFSKVTISVPQIPMISNVTGTWFSTNEPTNPDYWYRHLRQTVQFCKGIETLLEKDIPPFFMEIGPGQSLNIFLKAIAHHHKKKIISTYVLLDIHSQKKEMNQLLSAIGTAWQQGISIKWSSMYENARLRHIPLPTYSFQKQKYWVEPESKDINRIDHAPTIYKPVWSCQEVYKKPISLIPDKLAEHSWIIFNDGTGLGEQLIELLEKKNISPIVISHHEIYSEKNSRYFKINLNTKNHYLKFFQTVKNKIKNPIILHLSSYSDMNIFIPSVEEIDKQLTSGFYSLLYLTQAWLELNGISVPLKVGVITTGTQRLLGTEWINPVNAILNGSCRVIMQEHKDMKFRVMDLNPQEFPQNNVNLLSKIIDSCLNEDWNESSMITPYRNGYQWDLMYSAIKIQTKKIQRLKDNGIYLLTGGFGGIALSCCEAIVKTIFNPVFILLSRRKIPQEVEWQDILQNPTHNYYKKIKQICKLKELGATFEFYQVDIAQCDPLDSVINQCVSRFGKLDGLIHAAGISNAELIESTSERGAKNVFLPKIYGTYNLARSLKNLDLDFVILKSSLAALVGGFRQIDYAGANAFLDSIAKSDLFSFCPFVVSINWNTWRDVGIAAEAASRGEASFLGKGNDISPQEGQELFLKILQQTETNVAVSNSDINCDRSTNKIEYSQSLSRIKIARQDINVVTDYLSPSNEMESKLTEIWQDMLGIEKIGVTDDFFALGGHSLKAISMIEKINNSFHCRLPATQLYHDPTIRQLCSIIKKENKLSSSAILLKKVKKNPPYLFLCHPISGFINCFHDFVSQSELPVSIYGIQDPGIKENRIIYDNLPAMAEDYLSVIQKIQPVGPYFLAGYSFGGNLFYEVAHRLQKQGQKIGLLVLIDSWAINSPALQNETLFKNHFKAGENALPNDMINLAWEREQLLINHSPSICTQEMLLLKASVLSDIYKSVDSPTNGWAKYNKGKIRCHTIYGNHETIINKQGSRDMLHLMEHYLTASFKVNNELVEKCTD